MAKCCDKKNPCPERSRRKGKSNLPKNRESKIENQNSIGPLVWFGNMIQNCYEYACAEKAKGRHIVGIMCEYTPRELIMAADAVPVCLCGGSAEMIGPAEEHLPAHPRPLITST